MTPSEQTLTSLIVGGFMPIVVDMVNKDVNNPRLRLYISLIMCAAVGVFINIPNIKHGTGDEVVASIIAVIISAQAVYKKFYENSKLQTIMRGGD